MVNNSKYSSTTDPIFSPLKIKNTTLKNRIMSTSHACGMGDGGLPGLRYQRYHEEKAKGGLALTMFGGSSNVAPDSPNVFEQLRVDNDEVIPYLQQFSDRIHAHGTAIMCQITHLGRRGNALVDNWLPTIAPSAIRETLHRGVPRVMDNHDIQRVIKSFGAAAKRCYEGGLDGIETHAGAHLIGQFFSPYTNQRTDKYGGSVENRARFALEVHNEIKNQVGDDFLVGMRMSMFEDRGGLSTDDAITIAQILQNEGAIDFLNCVFGRMDTEITLAEYNMPGMTQPLSPFLQNMKIIKQEINVPIFHAARIVDIASARYALKSNILDMVAMTRAHIADPEIVNKIARGEEHRIRPCIGASHCMHKRPSCLHNVATGRETFLPQKISNMATHAKKVLVVGGGPAGLEVARVAAQRGHNVTLWEAAAQLGGQLLLAKKNRWRQDMSQVIDWRIAELEHLNVSIQCNFFAEEKNITDYQADIVINATGGLPNMSTMDGEAYCTSGWDVLSGEVKLCDNVLVFDGTGRHEAPSYAQFAADNGANVTLVTLDDQVCAEMGYAERSSHRKLLYEKNINTHIDLFLLGVKPAGNRLEASFRNELTNEIVSMTTDQVIVENGTLPNDTMFNELSTVSSNNGILDIDRQLQPLSTPSTETTEAEGSFTIYNIGDSVSSRSLHAALLDAYRVGLII